MAGRARRGLAATLIALTVLAGGAISASAEQVVVAECAVSMGGTHVATCAKMMDKSVSTCALHH